MKPLRFATRVRLAFLAALAAVVAIAVLTAWLFPSPWTVLLACLGFGLPLGWWILEGLPLCREIVEAHGGRLRIERREGGGTAVVCWVPGA